MVTKLFKKKKYYNINDDAPLTLNDIRDFEASSKCFPTLQQNRPPSSPSYYNSFLLTTIDTFPKRPMQHIYLPTSH